MKLSSCVSVVVIGFESLDDAIRSSQFAFAENESRNNYFEGDKVGLCQYLVNHFCIPGSTTLDLSDDSEGLISMNSLYSYLTIC